MEEKLTEVTCPMTLAFSKIPLDFCTCHSISLECHPERLCFWIWDRSYSQCIDIIRQNFFSYMKVINNLTSSGISNTANTVSFNPQANYQFLESRHGTLIFVSFPHCTYHRALGEYELTGLDWHSLNFLCNKINNWKQKDKQDNTNTKTDQSICKNVQRKWVRWFF